MDRGLAWVRTQGPSAHLGDPWRPSGWGEPSPELWEIGWGPSLLSGPRSSFERRTKFRCRQDPPSGRSQGVASQALNRSSRGSPCSNSEK